MIQKLKILLFFLLLHCGSAFGLDKLSEKAKIFHITEEVLKAVALKTLEKERDFNGYGLTDYKYSTTDGHNIKYNLKFNLNNTHRNRKKASNSENNIKKEKNAANSATTNPDNLITYNSVVINSKNNWAIWINKNKIDQENINTSHAIDNINFDLLEIGSFFVVIRVKKIDKNLADLVRENIEKKYKYFANIKMDGEDVIIKIPLQKTFHLDTMRIYDFIVPKNNTPTPVTTATNAKPKDGKVTEEKEIDKAIEKQNEAVEQVKNTVSKFQYFTER